MTGRNSLLLALAIASFTAGIGCSSKNTEMGEEIGQAKQTSDSPNDGASTDEMPGAENDTNTAGAPTDGTEEEPVASPANSLLEPVPSRFIAPQKSRKLHYNANLTLASSESARISRVAPIIRKCEGKVIEQSPAEVIADIPAANLESAIEQIAKSFKVTSRELKIAELNSTFLDLEERRRALKALISKFDELLKSNESHDKQVLVGKIETMRKTLAEIEDRLSISSNTIKFSRMRVAVDAADKAAGDPSYLDKYFQWLGRIDQPRSFEHDDSVKALKMATPKGFGSLQKSTHVTAFTSPDNIRLQAFTRPNQPRGNAVFWQKKTAGLWARPDTTIKTMKSGKFRVVRIDTHKKKPDKVLLIAFRSRGKTLDVIVVNAPGKKAFTEYETRINAAISSAGGKT
ncbi:MAG: hypothetical protein RIQ81_549 [Pseudomonadota bacterium]|jgi:hypothetical protein